MFSVGYNSVLIRKLKKERIKMGIHTGIIDLRVLTLNGIPRGGGEN